MGGNINERQQQQQLWQTNTGSTSTTHYNIESSVAFSRDVDFDPNSQLFRARIPKLRVANSRACVQFNGNHARKFQRLSQPNHLRYTYFEVTIHRCRGTTANTTATASNTPTASSSSSSSSYHPVFGIGFGPPELQTKGMVGWSGAGIGYHADDGRVFNNENLPTNHIILELCSIGDTMGAGMDLESGQVFFTRNGRKLTGLISNSTCCTSLLPTVTLSHHEGIEFSVNLGQLTPDYSDSQQQQVPEFGGSVSSPGGFLFEDIIPENISSRSSLSMTDRLTTLQDLTKLDNLVTELKQTIDRIVIENANLKNQIQALSSETIEKEKRFCLTTTEAMTMSDDDLKRVKDQLSNSLDVIRTLEDRPDCCLVCSDAKRTVLFLPCKHCITCQLCAQSMIECPLCRISISDRMDIYL